MFDKLHIFLGATVADAAARPLHWVYDEKKLKSYLHHIDYDLNPVGEKGIQEMINNKRTIYNIKADQKENKFDGSNKLSKININLLPLYILENKDKLRDWIEE